MQKTGLLVTVLLVTFNVRTPSGGDIGSRHINTAASLSAPTYYLVVNVTTCETDGLDVRGASNLPRGALITLTAVGLSGDEWRDLTGEVPVPLDDSGFFKTRLHPLLGRSFRRNTEVLAYFFPFRPRQPDSVLKVVGSRGHNLGLAHPNQVTVASAIIHKSSNTPVTPTPLRRVRGRLVNELVAQTAALAVCGSSAPKAADLKPAGPRYPLIMKMLYQDYIL